MAVPAAQGDEDVGRIHPAAGFSPPPAIGLKPDAGFQANAT